MEFAPLDLGGSAHVTEISARVQASGGWTPWQPASPIYGQVRPLSPNASPCDLYR